MNDSTQLTLEPFATKLMFSSSKSLPQNKWKDHVRIFLKNISSHCEKTFSPFVGHIKMVAVFKDNLSLRANLVSPVHPVEFGGDPPDTFKQMQITINILVYGLEKAKIQELLKDVMEEFESGFDGRVYETIITGL